MFVNEIVTKTIIIDGKKFVERTINSKFKKGDATITTTYMDGRPLLKQYIFCGQTHIKNVWKDLAHGNRKSGCEVNKLDVLG